MVSIRTKLVATFITISIFFGLLATAIYFNNLNAARSFDELGNQSVPEITGLRQMITDSLIIYSRAVESTVEDNPEELQDYIVEIDEAKDDFSRTYREFQNIADPDLIKETASIGEDWENFALNSDKLIDLVQTRTASDQELDETREALEISQEEFQATVEKALATRLNQNEQLKAEVDSNEASLLALIVIAIVASVLFSTGLGFVISHRISSRLSELKKSAILVAKGNYKSEMPKISNDELGDLAVQFESMKLQLSEKDKMQKEFIMVASHELRTPIQPILGFTSLALDGKVPPNDALQAIQKEARRLKQLSDDILYVSKIESDKIHYDKKEVKIQKVIREVIGNLKPCLPNGVTLIEQLSAEDVLVEADIGRLQQVITNIVGNAIKFTERGSITVECSVTAAPDTVEIKIKDTGNGIPAEILPRLFGKFVSGDLDGRNKHGTGLGLFISRAIIEAHGGKIEASNNLDSKGATFTISLPVKHDTSIENTISLS